MIPYLGDFAEDETVYIYFNSFDSNDPSASVTVTNLIASDIFVYKDGSVTDIVTDGASVTIDFDSRTGLHKIEIDTSASADYAVGSDYMVMVNGITIDAGTVNAGIACFSIENRFNAAVTDGATLAAGAITDASLAGNMEIVFETDFATNYNTTDNGWVTNGTSFIGTGWNTGKTGYDLNADQSAVTVGTVTTATTVTNYTNDLSKYSGPRGPGVYLNDAAANTNTTNYTDGIITNPVSTIGAAKTIADSLSLDRIYIVNDSAITLAATMTDYEFVGIGYHGNNTVALASQTLDNSTFWNLTLSGVQAGTGLIEAFDCQLDTGTYHVHATRCGLIDSVTGITFSNNDDNILNECYSEVTGNGTPVLICSAANLDLSIRHYSGGVELKTLNATATVSVETDGQVVFNADCNTGAVVTMRGNMTITDNTGGMSALTTDAVYDKRSDITAILADTNELQGDWVNDGRLDAILDTVNSNSSATQTDWADGGRLDLILDTIDTEIKKLTTTAHAEPTGVPAVNEAPIDKLAYLFMALRNQVTVTATKKTFFDDGGAAEWEKDLSDDGTTYTETEGNAI